MASNYTPSVAKAQAKYNKEKTTGVYLKLNNRTDADILDRLEELAGSEGKQGYIKRLIREDMKRNA